MGLAEILFVVAIVLQASVFAEAPRVRFMRVVMELKRVILPLRAEEAEMMVLMEKFVLHCLVGVIEIETAMIAKIKKILELQVLWPEVKLRELELMLGQA